MWVLGTPPGSSLKATFESSLSSSWTLFNCLVAVLSNQEHSAPGWPESGTGGCSREGDGGKDVRAASVEALEGLSPC